MSRRRVPFVVSPAAFRSAREHARRLQAAREAARARPYRSHHLEPERDLPRDVRIARAARLAAFHAQTQAALRRLQHYAAASAQLAELRELTRDDPELREVLSTALLEALQAELGRS